MVGMTAVAGVPLIFWPSLFGPFSVPKLALLSACSGLMLGASFVIANRPPLTSLRDLTVPLLAITVPWVIGWLFAEHRYWALMGSHERFLGVLPALLLLLFGYLLAQTFLTDTQRIARALSWAGAGVGGYAAAQFLGLDVVEGGRFVAASTLGNPNFTGGVLAMILPVSAMAARLDHTYRNLHLSSAALAAAGLIVSNSQGGWLAGAAALIVLALGQATGRTTLRVLLASALVVCVLAGPALVLQSLPSAADSVTLDSIQQRALWWQRATALWSDNPLVGLGPEAFALEGQRNRPVNEAVAFSDLTADDPHSVPLSYLVTGGLVGGVGYIVLLIWSVWMIRSSTSQPESLKWGFAAGLAAYITQSTVSIDELPLRVILVACMVGVLGSPTPSSRRAKKPSKLASGSKAIPPLRIAMGATAIAVGLSLGGLLLGADQRIVDADRTSTDDAEAGLAQARSAMNTSPLVRYEEVVAELTLVASDEFGPPAPRVTEAFERLQRYPDPRYRIAYANYLKDHSDLEGAKREFNLALEIDPNSPRARVGLARISLSEGDARGALELLEPLIPYASPSGYNDDALADLWGVYSLALRESGAAEQSQEAAQRALELDPTQQEAQQVVEGAPPN